jgi:phosphinothricin acetyltransferase
VIVRPATGADLAAITAIYAHHVLHGLGTFEEEPPSVEEIGRRIAAVRALDLPYLVGDDDGKVVGFAYAAPFRPRTAYRYTVEDSVYVAPAAIGHGVGRALVGELIAMCELMAMRQMLAVIGDSANAASIGLHRSLGFKPAGVCKAVGFKKGGWVDTVWMQRPLNAGDSSQPEGRGLPIGGG